MSIPVLCPLFIWFLLIVVVFVVDCCSVLKPPLNVYLEKSWFQASDRPSTESKSMTYIDFFKDNNNRKSTLEFREESMFNRGDGTVF